MKRVKKSIYALLAVGCLVTTSWGFEYKNTPNNLKVLFETMLKAKLSGDDATAAKLTQALLPTKERLKVALKDDVPDEFIDKIMKRYSKVPPKSNTKAWASIFTKRPSRSKVSVYGATTQEIIANKKGSIVYKEFPGGAVQATKSILKKNVTFYEVERTKPNKSRGYKQHLFFWYGKGWCMLGPIWRFMKKPVVINKQEKLNNMVHSNLPQADIEALKAKSKK